MNGECKNEDFGSGGEGWLDEWGGAPPRAVWP